MKVGIYFCGCGAGCEGQVSAKIDPDAIRSGLAGQADAAYLEKLDFGCADTGVERMVAHLREQRPDRVVVAACSPRDHEQTFRRVLQRADMNPYLLQMVNIREQVAWVTEDTADAVAKATSQIRAAVARVVHQRPLHSTELDVSTDVLVIGGGPAGLKAALTLAEAGRSVTIVERSAILGGMPARFEEIFPKLECAPCVLEPVIGEVLHGELPGRIDVRPTSEVISVKGYLGNFDVKIRTAARHVSVSDCVGCGLCVEECPQSTPNPLNLNRTTRKAIDFELFGGLPNAPVLDESACVRFRPNETGPNETGPNETGPNETGPNETGTVGDCTACRDICPVDGAVLLDETESFTEIKIGAIVVAVGSTLYDLSQLDHLGYGQHPDVLSSWDAERMLAANGPTHGEVRTADGRVPARVAIVHCAGSLDSRHVPYCSSICCQTAFKFAHMIENKLPDTKIVSLFQTIVAPGKEAYAAYEHARRSERIRFVHYENGDKLHVRTEPGQPPVIAYRGEEIPADLVVLMAPVVPSNGLANLARRLEIGLDAAGFLAENNPRTDATRANVRGIYVAGGCQSPTDLAGAMTQGAAAASGALSALVQGRTLTTEPIIAEVDTTRCSGCRTCVPVCPYRAIEMTHNDKIASINGLLCAGCGTCVAACPAGAITGHHFSDDAIRAEIEAVLS